MLRVNVKPKENINPKMPPIKADGQAWRGQNVDAMYELILAIKNLVLMLIQHLSQAINQSLAFI